MNKQIARVTWSRGRYSDIFRAAIVEPSPIKEGQRVHVIWGKSKKEYSAVLTCYPLVEEPASTPVQQALPQHRAKAKRKLVSRIFSFSLCLFSLSLLMFLFTRSTNWWLMMPVVVFTLLIRLFSADWLNWIPWERDELKREGSQQRSQQRKNQRRNQKERYVFYDYYVFR